MAETAVSLVIENLIPLLVQEARLLKGVHDKVAGIKDELQIIQSFLKDADARVEQENMSNVEKTWVKQIREEAYHIEDTLDEYILHLAKRPLGPRQHFHFSKTCHSLQDSRYQHQSPKKERDGCKISFQHDRARGLSNNARSVTWYDPRVTSLFIEEAEVVGIESHRDKLINDFLECLKVALPNNDKGSGIVITTRNEDVAPSHNESSSCYVHKQLPLPSEKLWNCSTRSKIVERCEGLPLAIVVIGGLLSSKDKTNSLWIAEGFVRKARITLEELAQSYLNQLIHRSLVQVVEFDEVGKNRYCRVHDMLREVILSRSEELNFCLVSIQNYSSFDKIARRLSVMNNINTPSQSISNSQTRSILIFGLDKVPDSFLTTCFANFKLMKTMDFEGAPIDYIPKEVGNLLHLRYLSLRYTKVKMLPKSIGKLHYLETLDLKRSLVSELPAEISRLHKLRYLAAYIVDNDVEFNIDFPQAVKIPSGIGRLQSLQKLYKIEANNNALITELGSLGTVEEVGDR
ncbi:hypothetical protein RGQ29_026543 [Quercus rubra]|uniref:Rx N-terminal domain-containing protein n=1 Tax=Quercus rubra TaxID=3512 RepID=A0AAN7ELP5_QUERU|nr:hypothetical protein RGQ29_026543 [Quercus rubra]